MNAIENDLKFVIGACPHDCPDTCAIVTEVNDGKAVRISGHPDHPLTQGWLCVKVRDYLEWVDHPERILYPLRRSGAKGSGTWQRISWDDALTEIASRWHTIIKEYGGAAILPYSYSGTLGLVQMGVASSRLWNRLGASGLERSICGAAAERAVTATLGARWSPDPAQLVESRLIVLWGHNPASTAPHLMPIVREAQRRGCYVVLIDPQTTLTAKSVDEHLAPRPATDGALALGLMHVLQREGFVDEAWLKEHAIGWPDLRRRIADYSPERVSVMTGLSVRAIEDLATRYGTSRPALIKIADGLQRHQNGGQTIRAICCLPAVTGNYGRRGGGLAYSTSGYAAWDIETVGKRAHCVPSPRTINMNRLGAVLTDSTLDPPIRSLYVFGANPMTSTPNSARVEAGLHREDLFTVVHELFMTDTARYADIVLPATSQLEQWDLHRAYGQRTVTLNQPALAPRGEAKSNWDTMRALAKALGFTDTWLHDDAETVIDEILQRSAEQNSLLKGVTFERLKREGFIELCDRDHVPFSDGKFPTPSGKIELMCDAFRRDGIDPLPEYVEPNEFTRGEVREGYAPLILLSAAAHHFVSSSFGSLAHLRRKQGKFRATIHPHDASQREIHSGDRVLVYNDRGSFTCEAWVSDRVRPGVVSVPKGFWGAHTVDRRHVNWTTSDALGDLAGQSTFQSNYVWIRACP